MLELDIMSYCNHEIHCSCGRTHVCEMAACFVESGALTHLTEFAEQYHHILLAADANTFAVCGEKVRSILGSSVENTLVYPECEGFLVPDEASIDMLDKLVTSDTDLLIGIGSGVINDLCKYVSFYHHLPYIIVATAPSMDGYASSGAAMILGGMKVTVTTRPPMAIVADVDVLKNAPMDMIRSGYGDIIGKYSSLCDWKLSHLMLGEAFCPEIYDLVLQVVQAVQDSTDALVRREDAAIALLTKALILSGITLTLNGNTRPGSGSEHHLSHFYEIVGLIHHEPHLFHGTNVAYSTIVTAWMRQRICALSAPVFGTVSPETKEALYQTCFAEYADEVRSLQEKAGYYVRDMRADYAEKWQDVVKVLSECPSWKELTELFVRIGYDMQDFPRTYGHAKIANAMLFAKDLKDRYSFLWLYYNLFAEKDLSEGGAVIPAFEQA